MTAVAVEELSKRFRLTAGRSTSLKERALRGRQRYDEFWALRDVSFELQEGKTLGLLGHNGSGKSTLLKCIAGILKPTEGQALTKGRIASLLELGAGFHPELTGRENVFVNASFLGIASKEIERRFDDIVEFAELEQFIDQQVKYYSSGMFVRLGFSVAVNVDPDILLVDEVLAVGDENFQRKCLEKVRAFQREGRTILVVSHAADLMRQVADKVAVLDHGHLVAFDEPGPAIRVFREHLLEGQLERKAIEEERRRSAAAVATAETGIEEPPAPEPVLDVPPSLAHGAAQEAKRTLQIRFTSVVIEHDRSSCPARRSGCGWATR
jgi:ABC-2 type transport system ATP-binding protein